MKASDNEFPSILLDELASAPTTPATGFWRVYTKSDGLYIVDDAGAETGPFAGSVAAPTGTPYEIDYVEFTSSASVSATTEGTANTVVTANAESFDGSTVGVIEFFSAAARPAAVDGGSLSLWLYDGSSSIGLIGFVNSQGASSSNLPVHVMRRLTPSNASHTYSIRASVSTGTGSVGAGAGGATATMPGFIRISKLTA